MRALDDNNGELDEIEIEIIKDRFIKKYGFETDKTFFFFSNITEIFNEFKKRLFDKTHDFLQDNARFKNKKVNIIEFFNFYEIVIGGLKTVFNFEMEKHLKKIVENLIEFNNKGE